MAASVAELTAQVVALTDQVQTLTMRVGAAEHHAVAPTQSSDSGIFDKRKLYPKELKENTSFKTWSERFIALVAMENEEIAQAFHRAGKQEQLLDVSGLSPEQSAYSSALYGHLRALTEGFRKAAKIVRLVRGNNGLEAWRRLTRRFHPQSPEAHAAQLEHIIMFGSRNAVKHLGDVLTVLDQFQRVMDDYEEAMGVIGSMIK